MTEAHPEIIIVKRHSAHEEEHHGGAWKIAFADFMTAMMAFFLVLWIISATDKNTKTLIARYFNPVKVEEPAKAQKGIHGAPEKGAIYAPDDGAGAPNAGAPSSEHGEGPAEKGSENPSDQSKQNEQARPPTPSPSPPPDPAKPYPTMSEQELFSDPRASLDKIAGAPPPGPRIDDSATLKGYGEAQMRGCAIRSVLSVAIRRLMWSRKIPARRRLRPPRATNPLPPRPRSLRPRLPLRAPLKPRSSPKAPARNRLLLRLRICQLPTPPRRGGQPRPDCWRT
jgi:chemotaxis protein MotB